MKNSQFCPKCGTIQGSFIKGFCQKCFLEDNPIMELPKKIEIAHCRKCGKLRVKGKWLEQTEEHIKKIVESNLKLKQISNPKVSVELNPLENGTTMATVLVCGKIGTEEISLETETILLSKEIVCEDCNLLDANYYEATLQLRFETKKQEKEKQKILDEIKRIMLGLEKHDSLARITSISKEHSGYNVSVGSKRAAKKIVEYFEKKHNAKIKSSFTLAGVNASGKVKKRFTFLIKI